MTAVIFRRRRLGLGSANGILNTMEEGCTIRTHNPLRRTARREGPWPNDTSLVIRWGCTARIPVDCNRVLNTVEAINLVNDKTRFRMMLNEHGLCPKTWDSFTPFAVDNNTPDEVNMGFSVIVRRRNHAQGRNLHVCSGLYYVRQACQRYGTGNYYISELINKSAEYRVFVAQGRAVWVARKTPGNPDDVAWNVARGGRFDNVSWGDWPLRVVRVAIEAFNLSGLDFGGVDVIVDDEGRAYVIEINSAPSQTSPYRQSCVARVFDYIIRNGKGTIPLIAERGGYRKFVHPAVCDSAQLPVEQ